MILPPTIKGHVFQKAVPPFLVLSTKGLERRGPH